VTAQRLGVGIVGAGRVGTVLGNALRSLGHAVVGATAVSEGSRERVELLLPGVPVLTVEEVIRRSEVVFVTVPDDAIAEVVGGAAALGLWQTGQIVIHTSGVHGLEVLEPARAAGALVLAIHPAMTFTGTSIDLARLTGCPFAVTAPAPLLPIAQALVVEMGGEPFVVAPADRAAYHAALTHGANHLVTLVAQAERDPRRHRDRRAGAPARAAAPRGPPRVRSPTANCTSPGRWCAATSAPSARTWPRSGNSAGRRTSPRATARCVP
jgi:Uncharacterized conserved protein